MLGVLMRPFFRTCDSACDLYMRGMSGCTLWWQCRPVRLQLQASWGASSAAPAAPPFAAKVSSNKADSHYGFVRGSFRHRFHHGGVAREAASSSRSSLTPATRDYSCRHAGESEPQPLPSCGGSALAGHGLGWIGQAHARSKKNI